MKTEPIIKRCIVCDTPFEACPPGRTSRTIRQGEYCSQECRRRGRVRRGKLCKVLSIADAAYIAGFFDGEGSVLLYNRPTNITLRVSFANTKRAILDWIRDTIGAGHIVTASRNNDKHATSYLLIVSSQSAASLLEQIAPYIHLKNEQAQLGIEFYQRLRVPRLKADKSWQIKARDRLRDLNQRGPTHQS